MHIRTLIFIIALVVFLTSLYLLISGSSLLVLLPLLFLLVYGTHCLV